MNTYFKSVSVTLLALTATTIDFQALAQTGSAEEPVRYIGGEIANPNVHDGAFRYAIGTENIQVVRANRTHLDSADGFGWTYNHAPNLTYWEGKFFLQYLSNPINEHEDPGHTLLVTSEDGRNWDMPVEIFPPYPAPEGVEIPEGYHGYMMHQRMGFYTAKNGRLLTLAFYGHTKDPFKQGGIGRVVREIKEDGTFGPIYFIRYTSHADWNASNTAFPFYTSSPDAGFVAACDELLADKLATLQWWDEDHGLDGFYSFKDTTNNLKAASIYTRKDGKTVALWKRGYATLSDDKGMSWSEARAMPTLIMSGGKNWGQRTKDGRYAMSYNPIATTQYRYPLIVTTSEDGILFDNMSVVHGEVPPRRFYGGAKDFGPNYMRGIEGPDTPPGEDMWLVYSVNKEDIWISRIPLPIAVSTGGPVKDDFENIVENGKIPNWNIYRGKWVACAVAVAPGGSKALRFADSDPYDYARAIRVFETGTHQQIQFKVLAGEVNSEPFEIDVTDRYGSRPFRLILDGKGSIQLDEGTQKKVLGTYEAGTWYTFDLNLSCDGMGLFDLQLNGRKLIEKQVFAEKVKSVERISFRTGAYRNLPNRQTPNQVPHEPLKNADERQQQSLFYIDDVIIRN